MGRYYNGQYILTVPQNLLDMLPKSVGTRERREWKKRKGPIVYPECIHWRPSRVGDGGEARLTDSSVGRTSGRTTGWAKTTKCCGLFVATRTLAKV